MKTQGAPGAAAEPDDAVLLESALLGDREALAGLVRRHWGRVFGYLVRLSTDYHLAQDLTQETFYRMWRGLPGLRETTPFRTWLYRIAHNVFVDHARSWHGRNVMPAGDLITGGPDLGRESSGAEARPEPVADAAAGAGPADEDDDPDPVVSIVERRLERSRATALLRRLSPDHRAVVVLRFYEELSLGEIAETLEVPVGTVKSRLYYAFRELRRALDEGEGRGSGGRARVPSGAAGPRGSPPAEGPARTGSRKGLSRKEAAGARDREGRGRAGDWSD